MMFLIKFPLENIFKKQNTKIADYTHYTHYKLINQIVKNSKNVVKCSEM